MSRDWRLYWDDMVAAADKVMKYTSGMDVSSFSADERTRDAVLRNLEIIGEASKRIPAEELKRANGLDWRKVVGFRDIVAHAYFAIDDDILWDIVSNKVPALVAVLKQAGRTRDSVVKRLGASLDPIDREAAAVLLAWQDAKTAGGKSRHLGRLPGQINERGCIAVISAVVRRGAIGFEEVGPEQSFEAVVDRHPDRFEPEVVSIARQRLLKVSKK